MYGHVEKAKDNKSKAVANSVGQKKNSEMQDFGFEDNREESVSQAYLQRKISDSARMRSQQKQMNSVFDDTIQRVKFKTERERFIKSYPAMAQLVANIDVNGKPTDILDGLVANYKTCGFIYDMTPVNPQNFLKGCLRGDCSTLAKSFVIIAKDFFDIEGIEWATKNETFAVPGGGKVLDANNATGNVDNGSHWLFTSHTWVKGPDRKRDILFNGDESAPSGLDMEAEGYDGEIEYRQFGGKKIYAYLLMGDTLANKYTTDIDKAQQAKVEQEKLMREAFEESERLRKVSVREETTLDSEDEDIETTIREFLLEIKGFPKEKIGDTIKAIISREGENPDIGVILKHIKLFCTGNPISGFTYGGDTKWDEWIDGDL